MTKKRIYLYDADTIHLDSPYNEVEVVATKKIPGARWAKMARVWEFPISSLPHLREFAEQFDYELDPKLGNFALPSQPTATERVEITEKKFRVFFAYDPVKVAAIRNVQGAAWDKKEAWNVPLTSAGNLLAFLDQFKIEIPNRGEIEAIHNEVTEQASEMEALSRTNTGSLIIPTFEGNLFNYQRGGVEYLLKAKKSFIADTVGLGKTREAIATLEYADAFPAVVAAPPSLILNWKKEIETLTPHRKVAIITNRKDFPEGDFDYLVVGDSNIATWKEKLTGYKSYVFDESQRLKNFDAQRTKAAIAMAKKAEYVFLLTGTPIMNRPAEFASQLEILGRLKDFGGKWGFYKRYCGAYRDSFGVWNILGSSNLEELNKRLRSSCYLRRTKDDVLLELPEARIDQLPVSPDEKIMKEYRKAEDDIASFLATRAAQIAMEMGLPPRSAAVKARIKAESAEHLVRLSTLRRLAALAKLPAIFEWIDERLEEGVKVVVGAHHRDVVDAIAEKYGNIKIQGGMDAAQVEANKQAFQEGDAQVMVISIQAGGTGHTLTAAQDLLVAELPWVPADVDQLVGRLHRIGQKGSVLAIEMIATGTIDEKMIALLEKKRKIVKAGTDGEAIRQESLIGDLIWSFLDDEVELDDEF